MTLMKASIHNENKSIDFYFRDGTIDSWVADQVINKNEYHVEHFKKTDHVIDIGGHIGCFTLMAYLHGCKNIHTYEVDTSNFEVLQLNTEKLKGVSIHNKAVWRSDVVYPTTVSFTGYDGPNTGSGNTVFGDGEKRQVEAVSLDDIISDQNIRLIKIDCESGEWPILLTCTKLNQVKEIVGEYHEIGGEYDTNNPHSLTINNYTKYTIEELDSFLRNQGFTVEHQRYVLQDSDGSYKLCNLGYFRAYRNEY